MNQTRSLLLVLALVLLAGGLGAAAAQESDASAPLTLESVTIEPKSPAVDTLCRLSVTLRNDGSETASQFGLAVTVNGTELPVYRNQLFMYPVPPGESVEVPLYNFWSTETSRPAPGDGKLTIEVELREAQWMKIEMEDEVEVWTPLGAIEGLPISASLTATMAAP